jgi:hypothetical protein
METQDTKSFVIPLEKIQEQTAYGTLETVILPRDPYELHGEPRPGRGLILKNQEDFHMIAYIPETWQITLRDDGMLRAHGLIGTTTFVHEGHLWDANAIDPWKDNPEEIPYMPWASHYLFNLKKQKIEGTPKKKPQPFPLVLNTHLQNPILATPNQTKIEIIDIRKNLPPDFNHITDHLTCHQKNMQTHFRKVKSKTGTK